MTENINKGKKCVTNIINLATLINHPWRLEHPGSYQAEIINPIIDNARQLEKLVL
jgi:hypothetical protein